MSDHLFKVWTTKRGVPRPVTQFCREFGWPLKTECGETMYDNSHFLSEAEAWGKLMLDLELHVSAMGRGVIDARSVLDRANQHAANAAAEFHAAREAHEDWCRTSKAAAAGEAVHHEGTKDTKEGALAS